jgi:hypothetical protein
MKALKFAVLTVFGLMITIFPHGAFALDLGPAHFGLQPVWNEGGKMDGVRLAATVYFGQGKFSSSPSSSALRGLYAADNGGVVAPEGSNVALRAEVDPSFKGTINQNTNYQEATSLWGYVLGGVAIGAGIYFGAKAIGRHGDVEVKVCTSGCTPTPSPSPGPVTPAPNPSPKPNPQPKPNPHPGPAPAIVFLY